MATQDIEVLVIIRGGGSWESLQAFNTESVVRAIAGFACPVLTGIGHDVDVTLAELVADRGVSTPTAVAEALNATWDTLAGSMYEAESRIMNLYGRRLMTAARLIDATSTSLFRTYDQVLTVSSKRLTTASSATQTFYRMLEKQIIQAGNAFQVLVGVMKTELKAVEGSLHSSAVAVTKLFTVAHSTVDRGIDTRAQYLLQQQGQVHKLCQQSLTSIEQTIKLSDPARTLQLGYSLSYSNGKLLRSVANVRVGERIETRLSDGKFTSEINTVL